MKLFTLIISLLLAALFSACSPSNGPATNGPGGSHNLSADEMRRAEINANAYYSKNFPAGLDEGGQLVLKQGAFSQCRPQDSNSNWLVTCAGNVPHPTIKNRYETKTMYCGYGAGENAILGCSDKDQK